jgi:hypothetical protein
MAGAALAGSETAARAVVREEAEGAALAFQALLAGPGLARMWADLAEAAAPVLWPEEEAAAIREAGAATDKLIPPSAQPVAAVAVAPM